MKIYKREGQNFYTIDFLDHEGYRYIVTAFPTFNEAYEHYIKFFKRKDDLK